MHILGYLIVGAVLGMLSGLVFDSRDGKTAWKYAMGLLLLFALLVRYGR